MGLKVFTKDVLKKIFKDCEVIEETLDSSESLLEYEDYICTIVLGNDSESFRSYIRVFSRVDVPVPFIRVIDYYVKEDLKLPGLISKESATMFMYILTVFEIESISRVVN